MAAEVPERVPVPPINVSPSPPMAVNPQSQQHEDGWKRYLNQDYAVLVYGAAKEWGEGARQLVVAIQDAVNSAPLIENAVVCAPIKFSEPRHPGRGLSDHGDTQNSATPNPTLIWFNRPQFGMGGFGMGQANPAPHQGRGTPDEIACLQECLLQVLQTGPGPFDFALRTDLEHVRTVITADSPCASTSPAAVPIRRNNKAFVYFEVPRHLTSQRAAAARKLAIDDPHAVTGMTATRIRHRVQPYGMSVGGTSDYVVYCAEITAYSPRRKVHYTFRERIKDNASIDFPALEHRNVVIDLLPPGLAHPVTIAPGSRYFRECMVCDRMCSSAEFAEFCFRRFRVTAHSREVGGPRHPGTICTECLRRHASIPVEDGKLYVPCPALDCGRSLQTLELQEILPPTLYSKLIAGIRDMESNPDGGVSADNIPSGLELKMCPECHARIEKDEGCSMMTCYRCGHSFNWSQAQALVVVKSNRA